MNIQLYDHQKEALQHMHNGCILCGGVGSGKSRTSLAYYTNKRGEREWNSGKTHMDTLVTK